MTTALVDHINTYEPITLEQMSGVKLMNRIDTKFVTNTTCLLKLLSIATGDYRAQEINGERIAKYYTVYFDTDDFAMFTAHQNGHVNRQKLRIRCYVDSHLNFLEVKTKNNHKRTKKKRMSFDNFDPVHPRHDILFQQPDTLHYEDFLKTHLRYDSSLLNEKIENAFNRITLVNRAQTERVTIDTDLRFHNLATDQYLFLDRTVIIELKRDGLSQSPLLDHLSRLRIKPIGFSKYAIGSALTNSYLKQNRFKVRIRQISKVSGY